jgi:HPt (histidine-containing phosphotransfer) domain-containing protein
MNQPNDADPAPARTATESAAILLDRTVSLARAGGDRRFLSEMIDLYLAGEPALLDQVRDARRRGDADQMKRACHVLKGQVMFFGARVLGEALTRQNRRVAAEGAVPDGGDAAELDGLFDALRRQLQEFREEAARESADR